MQHAIPTRYRGILFRSKLEADWARTFDALGLTWEYEREGEYFGDQFYLPDFWLPRARQYVEVKAVWEPADLRKALALCRHTKRTPYRPSRGANIALIRAEPDGRFFGWPWLGERVEPLPSFHEMLLEQTRELALLRCVRCLDWWFAELDTDYTCRCCGAVDDWVDVAPAFTGRIEPWPLTTPEAA